MPYTGARVLERNREGLDRFLGSVEEGDLVAIAYAIGPGYESVVRACGQLDVDVTEFPVYGNVTDLETVPADPKRNANRAIRAVAFYLADEVERCGGETCGFIRESFEDADIRALHEVISPRRS